MTQLNNFLFNTDFPDLQKFAINNGNKLKEKAIFIFFFPHYIFISNIDDY
jgi:hypothetical protein